MSAELSIIIVNWNTRDLLAGCLASVRSSVQEFRQAAVETLVVDNASEDGSAAMVREEFPWVRLIENAENVGFARANNQAIARTSAHYVLLLNADTQVRNGAFDALMGFMEANPAAGAAGARLVNRDGSLQLSCHPMLSPRRELWRLLFLDRVYPRASYPMHKWDTSTPRRVEVIKGACLLLRRAALQQVGLLDESYFMYTEEVDLCYRLSHAGWQLWYVPKAQVTHYGEASSRQVAEAMYVQLYRSKIHFYRKFGGESQADQFKRFVRLAYWPRLTLTTLGTPFSFPLAGHARTLRRLLDELPSM